MRVSTMPETMEFPSTSYLHGSASVSFRSFSACTHLPLFCHSIRCFRRGPHPWATMSTKARGLEQIAARAVLDAVRSAGPQPVKSLASPWKESCHPQPAQEPSNVRAADLLAQSASAPHAIAGPMESRAIAPSPVRTTPETQPDSSDHSSPSSSISMLMESTSGRSSAAGPACDLANAEFWQELLASGAEGSEAMGPRARSASDAAVLRRKGHLKEQDRLIEFLLAMHTTHTSLEAMQKLERWIVEHRQDPQRSRLARLVPSIGAFYTPLRLVNAFQEYDAFFALSRRRYVPPNFAEMRHVLNIAQVHASAKTLQLMTFDADGTLYEDGHHMQHDSQMIGHILALMRAGVHVAIVTAAGYPGSPPCFEARVEGLLAAFRCLGLPPQVAARFHLMGGECNYLLRLNGPCGRLAFVPDAEWKSAEMLAWRRDDIEALLDTAEAALVETADHLRLPGVRPAAQVIRKERAVGVVPTTVTVYEVLEELAIAVQVRLAGATALPFCAFNGGGDVFVDVGNKSLGIAALAAHLGVSAPGVLHVGDRFTVSGNDSAVRACCPILWVANPEETDFFVKLLLGDLHALQESAD